MHLKIRLRKTFTPTLPMGSALQCHRIRLPIHKRYFPVIVDCFDGRVVVWSTSTELDAEFANSNPRDACVQVSSDEVRLFTRVEGVAIGGRDGRSPANGVVLLASCQEGASRSIRRWGFRPP